MVVLRLAHALVFDKQAAGVEETHAVGADDEILVDDGLGFRFLSVEDQLAHLVQPGQRTGAVVVVRAAAPEGLLIELDLLFLDAAVNHGAHVRVAQGQRFKPYAGRGVIPQYFVFSRFGRFAAGDGEQAERRAENDRYLFHNAQI